jgi:16S rRNA (cytosine967-C5)-methyltransferase
MPSEARVCAYAVLRRVFEDGAYADRALQAQIQAHALDARNRALAMRIVYGAIQRRGTLDHVIERLAERPPGRLDAPVLAALRLGLYELLYLRGAPDHAVVADAVELTKSGARGGHGLVNAVLRRATREGADLLGGLSDDTPERAAVKHSHPQWIARLWWNELGAERARALMAYDNEPGEVGLRANTLVTDAPTLARELAATGGSQGDEAGPAGEQAGGPWGSALPVRTHTDPDIPEALVLEGPFDMHASNAWRRGAFIAQSRAAMLVSRVLAPAPGETVLDLCAAPGGKTTHLAALMEGTGQVVAVERDRRRAGALLRTAQRLRAHNVRVELADAIQPRPEGAVFDRVLVDPPCSGLGTLQARPDLRWRMEPSRLAELERTQARIFAAGAAAVRPGGVLVYSTCTISPTENERRIAAFLDANYDFALDDLSIELPALRHPSPEAPETVLTLPHRDRTAGFFIARLRREG